MKGGLVAEKIGVGYYTNIRCKLRYHRSLWLPIAPCNHYREPQRVFYTFRQIPERCKLDRATCPFALRATPARQERWRLAVSLGGVRGFCAIGQP